MSTIWRKHVRCDVRAESRVVITDRARLTELSPPVSAEASAKIDRLEAMTRVNRTNILVGRHRDGARQTHLTKEADRG